MELPVKMYLLVVNGKPEGPYTMTELKSMKVRPNDFVRTGGMDDYKEAHDVPELRELFGFKKPPHIPQYYGSFDQRLLASVIDWFIVSGIFICIVVSFLLFIKDARLRIIIATSLLFVVPVANFIYHVVMESSVKQGTIGKQLLNIKVCDLYGERITVAHAAGRNLAKLLSVLTLFIGYLYAFFNKKQQCLHDVIAETLVVKDRLI